MKNDKDNFAQFVRPICELHQLHYFGNERLWVVRSTNASAPHLVYPDDLSETFVKKVYIRQTNTKYDDARPIRLGSLRKRLGK